MASDRARSHRCRRGAVQIRRALLGSRAGRGHAARLRPRGRRSRRPLIRAARIHFIVPAYGQHRNKRIVSCPWRGHGCGRPRDNDIGDRHRQQSARSSYMRHPPTTESGAPVTDHQKQSHRPAPTEPNDDRAAGCRQSRLFAGWSAPMNSTSGVRAAIPPANRPTIRQLEYLVALGAHGHIGRAAAACYVSQPTLSTQIRQPRTPPRRRRDRACGGAASS